MSQTTAPALRSLLKSFIDYAGIFPPASVSPAQAAEHYDNYRRGEYAWMLRWLVVDQGNLASVPPDFTASVSLLAESVIGDVAAVESKTVIDIGQQKTSAKANAKPIYCEVSFADLDRLDAVKVSGCYAKMRTGGLKPEAIPSAAAIAEFINRCADLQLPFKATAGLHHPIRSMQALTYEAEAPRAVMHGFINVLMASAFAWQGATDIEPILTETDPAAFTFDTNAYWRGHPINCQQIDDMRANFMHSVGSCSFEEPIQDLKNLAWLS